MKTAIVRNIQPRIPGFGVVSRRALPVPGMNKVQCGNILSAMKNIKKNAIFDVAIADPPYNIGKDFGNDSDARDLPDYLN